ncbi:MAG: twin-arginine translocase TatA/TatE family subunit [Candidatus Undinarchaeales archaeon]|nr:twin-arginine translocase TatA/TatE family subunit [Candidatus Undinarchaeales archaeon]MDP7494679.1 twin-arginine translocase TatA/TatE family subunit [Candidatus Undinarchaeales archaeon]
MVLGTMGGGEWLVVLLLAFLLFGPKKLPELARSLGLASSEYKKAVKDGEDTLKKRIDDKKSDVEKAAKALDIETKGKSEKELKDEIAERMKKDGDGSGDD